MDKNKFKELIKEEGSYRFLGAEDGYWIGVDDNGKEQELWIAGMSRDYRENCLKYLNKHKKNIETGAFLQDVKYDKADYETLIQFGCDAMNEKIKQLSDGM